MPNREPIWCEVKFACVDPKEGSVAHANYYCNTEEMYVCDQDLEYCHKRSHNWRELKEDEKV